MDWKAHIAIGAILCLAMAVFALHISDILLLLQLAAFAGLSALVPDLDHAMSKGKQILDIAVIIGAGILFISNMGNLQHAILLSLAVAGAYFVLFTFLKPRHRGITHSVIFSIIYGAMIYFIMGVNLAIAGFLGYFSHLLADREIKLI
jgi:inner membrane protein